MTSGFFNTSCPHRDDTWCTSPQHHLSALAVQSQARTSSSFSGQARLINPSPGIVTLLAHCSLGTPLFLQFFSPLITYQSPTSALTPWVHRRQGASRMRGSDSKLFEGPAHPASLWSPTGLQADAGSGDGMALHFQVQPMG